MAKCNRFKTFKERGEWVEALFIAELLRRGHTVLKPWGDSQPFDVALNFGNRIVKVRSRSSPPATASAPDTSVSSRPIFTAGNTPPSSLTSSPVTSPPRDLVPHPGAGPFQRGP